ncbi:ABC transporter ATP-binding protein [Myxococcota bacterium]|nr:ABC transporter ATP-binding protein [Myxococcota bacterium]
MSGSQAPIVELRGVTRSFSDGRTTRDVLRGVDLVVRAGELVALVGASGCGKTTLLNVLGALDADVKGDVTIAGHSLAALDDDARSDLRNRTIGFVFQSFHLLEHLSVGENVEVPLWLSRARVSRSEEAARAKEALDKVGLGDRLTEPVRPLSGGERQRVAIARAIINRPTLLLADEPTGNLDRETGRSIYALFDRIRRETAAPQGCAVVVATHDPELAKAADRVLTVKNGRIEGEA